jgi:signal transduction histidine kinase
MAATSMKPERSRVAKPEDPNAITESSTYPSVSDPVVSLRRANAELEMLYAIEQQVNTADALGDLIGAVLERVCASMGFAMAAALVVQNGRAEVITVEQGKGPTNRSLPLADAERLIASHRLPERRMIDAAVSGDELLFESMGVSLVESFSAPLSDGTAHCGLVQALSPVDLPETEHAALRRVGLLAQQLGRAIVLRRDREALLRAERMALLGQSLGEILHDMRTPIMAVSGFIDVMAGAESQELRREYAERASRGLEQMERMVQDVLAFARGRREVLLGKVHVQRFVEDVREMLVLELQSAGVSLEIHTEFTGTARFDESKMKRVLWNMARNACQAGSKKFCWRIERAGEYLVFECEDDGPGIPEALRGRLFESFATHGKEGGTGLGLSMAKKIIDAHCGRIHVRAAEGHGTVFRIELPI